MIFEENRQIPKEKDFEHFIGIDRGSHNNIATAVVQNREGEILESKFFSANEMLEKRRRYAKLRQQLGKRKLWAMIKKNKSRERNYIKDVNHKISTSIIQMASKYPNSVIVLEKLKGIRKSIKWSKNNNRKGHSWAFLELEEMLVYKAHRNSLSVRRVYPRGTSSVCKNCFGNIKRSPSILAVCETCKKEYNADWLGAVNITRRLFSYMLKNLGVSESRPSYKQGRDESKGSVIAPDPRGLTLGLVARLPTI